VESISIYLSGRAQQDAAAMPLTMARTRETPRGTPAGAGERGERDRPAMTPLKVMNPRRRVTRARTRRRAPGELGELDAVPADGGEAVGEPR
jgi:hypothetical protein